MTPPDGQSVLVKNLAFRALEIEEFADVHFFRPLGMMVARPAAALGITPIQITIFSAFIGVGGGALLYYERLGLLGFALLIVYSIFDSADGQLARLTNQVSELGRVLDGVVGYVAHAAIYIAITAALLQRGAGWSILVWAGLAVIANTMQAQMYEYHRHHYATIAVKGIVLRDEPAKITSRWINWLYRGYLEMQRMLNGLHVEVESRIAARARYGLIREEDRARYQKCFYGPVRGWNLLGDNTRFYAIGLLVCWHRLDLFFVFILGPMNLALVALWLWQRSADRKFIASL